MSSDERDNAEPSVLGYLRAHFPVVRSSHSEPCRNEEMLAYNLHAWQEDEADDIDGEADCYYGTKSTVSAGAALLLIVTVNACGMYTSHLCHVSRSASAVMTQRLG